MRLRHVRDGERKTEENADPVPLSLKAASLQLRTTEKRLDETLAQDR